MTLRIYVVDNGGQWTHREWRMLRYLKVDTKIVPNTTPLEQLDVDGLVLSGGAPRISGEGIPMGESAHYVEDASFPILGICLGCQFIAQQLGGTAVSATTAEFGKTECIVDDPNELLAGLPSRFTVWESHNDEIVQLPPDLALLAHSENCGVQAIAHRRRPLFGTQFHPEVEHTEHGREIFENFLRVCRG